MTSTGASAPASTGDVWAEIETLVRGPVPESWRRLLERWGMDQAVKAASSDEDRSAAIEGLAARVHDMAEMLPGDGETVAEAVPDDDGRWDLLMEFQQRLPALGITHKPVAIVRTEGPKSYSVFPGIVRHDFHIRFDARLSLDGLVRELRKVWPALIEEHGVTQRARPFHEKTRALLRFVCFEVPDVQTWRERWERWNAMMPADWAFKSERAFVSTFYRAEEKLTGWRRGLEGFYDPLASAPFDELDDAAKAGDQAAKRRLARMRRGWRESLLTPEYVHHVEAEGRRFGAAQVAARMSEGADELAERAERRFTESLGGEQGVSAALLDFASGFDGGGWEPVAAALRKRAAALGSHSD